MFQLPIADRAPKDGQERKTTNLTSQLLKMHSQKNSKGQRKDDKDN